MPVAVKILGYGGLVPFIGLAGISMFAPLPLSEMALAGLAFYGAIILSFLGGLHWGRLAASNTVEAGKDTGIDTGWLIWSVVPSLWAWGAIWLVLDNALQLLLIAAGLCVCWAVDRQAIAGGLFASWMGRLRRDLTLVATLSLVSAALF